MSKWSAAPIATGIGCLVLLSLIFVNQKRGRASVANGLLNDDHQVNAEVLEHEVRSGLPLGSSLSTVEDYLSTRGIEFSFESPSKIVYAIVRKIKGSSPLLRKDLAFQFHFDDALNLQSIDAKVRNTGP
jgi:hypothetical protein